MMDNSRFVGTWSLVSIEARGDDGTVTQPFGFDPVGLLIYDAAGHMAVQLAPRIRAPYAIPDMMQGSPTEDHAAITTYSAYFGTYDVHADGTVVHHTVANLFPNTSGRDQVRHWRFDGDRLTLTADTFRLGGVLYTLALVWQRVG